MPRRRGCSPSASRSDGSGDGGRAVQYVPAVATRTAVSRNPATNDPQPSTAAGTTKIQRTTANAITPTQPATISDRKLKILNASCDVIDDTIAPAIARQTVTCSATCVDRKSGKKTLGKCAGNAATSRQRTSNVVGDSDVPRQPLHPVSIDWAPFMEKPPGLPLQIPFFVLRKPSDASDWPSPRSRDRSRRTIIGL